MPLSDLLLPVKAVLEDGGLEDAELYHRRIQDMPLDEWPGLDGDDSWHSVSPHDRGVEVGDPGRALSSVAFVGSHGNVPTKPRGIYVPLKRTLKQGMRGKDVLALQRAMAKAGFRKWGAGFTGIFGPGLKEDVKQLQKRHGLLQTGIYNMATHAYGKRYFDLYGAHLMASVKVAPTVSDVRQRIVAAAMFSYHNRYLIHYTQGPLRMYGVRNRIRIPRVPYYEDCSSISTWYYWHAGVRDPNGLGYNGYGFTGTLASHGKRTFSPQPGDLALYGRSYPYTHVTTYIGNGRCISHGSEVGPLLLNVNYRPVNHFRTYL